MLALASTWWLVCLLLHVPRIANAFAVAWAERTQGRLDHALPDDLPLTAGQWLRARLGDRLQLIVTDDDVKRSTNGYHVLDHVIQMTHQAYFKADPTYWATAAHELGHARIHEQWPRLCRWLLAVQAIKRSAAWFAAGLLVGNLAFALPAATHLAYLVFVGALVLHLPKLHDEAWASRIAMRELRDSGEIWPTHLRAARAVLVTAFMTYLSLALAYVVMLSQWHAVLAVIGAGRLGSLAQLTTVGWVVAAIATGICAAHVIVTVARLAAPLWGRARLAHWVLELLWRIAVIVLVGLAWNLRADPTWAWCVLLAIVPVAAVATGVLGIPGAPVAMVCRAIAHRWRARGKGWHRSREWLRARDAGAAEVADGNRRVLRLGARILPMQQFYDLCKLAYVPLLIALWVIR